MFTLLNLVKKIVLIPVNLVLYIVKTIFESIVSKVITLLLLAGLAYALYVYFG